MVSEWGSFLEKLYLPQYVDALAEFLNMFELIGSNY